MARRLKDFFGEFIDVNDEGFWKTLELNRLRQLILKEREARWRASPP